MISSLAGTVESVGLNQAVIAVSGFGMQFSATPQTLAGLRTGEPGRVLTTLVVREDSMTLFGFATPDEKEVFEVLLGVSGVGPRLALAVLAVHDPETVRIAAHAGDDKAFTKVPGIGPKGARRIVLELADKLVPTGAPVPAPADGGDAADAQPWLDPVLEALTGLGWTERDADKAVRDTVAHEPELEESGDVASVLRATLRHLGQGQSARSGRS
ncbi:Holliday junction branch migration protein RuvA [Citricoccus sp. SGAir0253]|uniref:Holliday junction branch migration protein RuvA n=1 Tax=Citricoccus sp. SGAir0253 TaxID=2567881 RepID=UPI0010CCC395|nr:Holliday junction branch migration protein RuvA [Citricoccus sp. SGAir0253]QCU77902.1 Holliday junction branch migration protein RuvA [Citricoccus sp. SGAir0253]